MSDTARDSSKSRLNGIIVNAEVDVPGLIQGDGNTAFRFNGTDAYVDIPNGMIGLGSVFTEELWFDLEGSAPPGPAHNFISFLSLIPLSGDPTSFFSTKQLTLSVALD